MGNIETTTKFIELKIIILLLYVIYLFSSVSLQLKRKTISLYYEENVHGNWI